MTSRSRGHAWYVLGLLTAINFMNYVDRLLVVGMYDDLRAHFQLSNIQLGALTTAFFAVHAITTIPFGWAADHWDRRKVLTFGVVAWSVATLCTGYATNFWMLILFLGLIGIGEAAYGPVSNAVLCETFRPEEKARTVAIFNGGMFAGACFGVALGGYLGFPRGFQVVAIPGLVLAVMVAFLKVPRRRADVALAPSPPLRVMIADSNRSLRMPTLRWMLLGGILISFAAGGYIAWFADFIAATKGFTKENSTLVLGVIALTAGPSGVVIGGVVADRIYRRLRHGRTLGVALGFFLALPFAIGAIFIDAKIPFLICAWLLMFFLPWYNGPMAAVIDDVVDDEQASTAQASFSFRLHLLGTAPASTLVGAATTAIGPRMAMLVPTVATALAGVFCLIAGRYVDADMRARAERHERKRAAAA